MANFGLLVAEIDPVVRGTQANFNCFRVLAALLHGSQVVSISQTLRRWTGGATYVRQGDHHIGHWPTFSCDIYVVNFLNIVVKVVSFDLEQLHPYDHILIIPSVRVPRKCVPYMGAFAACAWSARCEPAYAVKWAGSLHATQLGSTGGGVQWGLSQQPVHADCGLSYTAVQATITQSAIVACVFKMCTKCW